MASKKAQAVFQIPVTTFKEGKMFVAYSPAFDLSSCGETFEKAQKNFEEAVDIFIEECMKDKTLGEVLESLGWQKLKKGKWSPPNVISQKDVPISIPDLVHT